MDWQLEFTRRAERDLVSLTRGDREAVRRSLDRLLAGFETPDLEKLSGRQDQWWLRVGSGQAILRVDHEAHQIVVLRILPRRNAGH